jgi:hypothetical protein
MRPLTRAVKNRGGWWWMFWKNTGPFCFDLAWKNIMQNRAAFGQESSVDENRDPFNFLS